MKAKGTPGIRYNRGMKVDNYGANVRLGDKSGWGMIEVS